MRACIAFLACLVLVSGCAVRVPYQGDEAIVSGLDRDQREQMFAEMLSRARKPRVYQVWIDDSSYGYDSARTARDGFGIPVGYYGSRRIVYFANVGELRLYDNNAVFVLDTSGRLVDKLVFGNQTDAARMIDLLTAYRERRYRAEASPGPRRGHRYDRRYEDRRPYEPGAEPGYEEPPPEPPYDDERGPYDMQGNRRDGYDR